MAKITKTFNLGERCKTRDGKLTIEVAGKIIFVKTNGLGDGSVEIDDKNAYRKLDQFISEITTSYLTEKVLDWVISKTKLEKKFFFE